MDDEEDAVDEADEEGLFLRLELTLTNPSDSLSSTTAAVARGAFLVVLLLLLEEEDCLLVDLEDDDLLEPDVDEDEEAGEFKSGIVGIGLG